MTFLRNLAAAILAMLVAATSSQVVFAQAPQPATVRASSIGGLGFALPAVRASDKDLIGTIDFVANNLNLTCSRSEAFTWSGIVPDSPQGKDIFLSIIEALEVKGYEYVQRDLPIPKDAELAKIQREMRAYSSESADRFARDLHILTVWYREADQISLMVCTALEKKKAKEE